MSGGWRILELPWPPSINHYYRVVHGRQVLGQAGRRYREMVESLLAESPGERLAGPLEIAVELYPPDRRRRDIDNYNKCLLDALTVGGLWEDDSQVRRMAVAMQDPVPEGAVVVRVRRMG